jgi:hypothetical protein
MLCRLGRVAWLAQAAPALRIVGVEAALDELAPAEWPVVSVHRRLATR